MCEGCDGKARITAADEGDPFWYDGGLMTMRARPADTGGSISLIDVLVPKGKATPLHVHPDAEESFYVIDGLLTVHVDGINHELSAGGASTIRRGTPHAFAVRSDTAHLLVVFTPGGGEEFFIEAGEPAARRELPPEAAPDTLVLDEHIKDRAVSGKARVPPTRGVLKPDPIHIHDVRPQQP